MSAVFGTEYSWGTLLLLGLGLLASYWLVRLTAIGLPQLRILLAVRDRLRKVFEVVLIVYGPLAVLFWVGAFIGADPWVHGIVSIAVFVASFTHLRDFLSGRLVLLRPMVAKGSYLAIGNVKGRVDRMGILGLTIRSEQGIHHVGYFTLLTGGFVLVSEEDGGIPCTLTVTPSKNAGDPNVIRLISDQLSASPYVDWSYPPVLRVADEKKGTIMLQLNLNAARYGVLLMEQLREAGYQCEIIEQ
jgi:hypothetical protein